MSNGLYVAALYRYPIKSCRGESVAEAYAEPRGFRADRRMMIVDPDGRMVTQRDDPRLALIAPRLEGDLLHLAAPGMPELHMSLVHHGVVRRVEVWGDECLAVDQGDTVAEWLGAYLGASVRLVRMVDSRARATRLGNGEVGFADGYPYLVVNQASLDDLNRRLSRPAPMSRFRPNLVVAGGEPFEEDAWRRLQIGEVVFELVKPCSRCAVVEIDPDRAVVDRGVLAALASYRRGEGKAYFGYNALARAFGLVRVGMSVARLD